ncbi:MAG: C10 family peptidase [Candidatus Eisenbacteria sp.]|nr:C10 family peptidase [Candidatus Eisenbacteria bacterium]
MRIAHVAAVAIVLVLGVSLSGQVWAERATRAEMEQVCRNWLSYMVHQTGDWAGSSRPAVSSVAPLTDEGTLLALCYSIHPGGHVVVPILKDLPPVKAYSENCGIDPDETVGYAQFLRDILRDRIGRFVAHYGGLDAIEPVKGDRVFHAVNREEWAKFLLGEVQFASLLEGGTFAPLTEVGPLVTAKWHQQEPFNNLCPMGDGERCVVGCLATAMVQVMNYHEWPPTGRRSLSYYWNGDQSCGGTTPGDTLFADFSNPYDWANMPDSCHYGTSLDGCVPVEENAVAELNYEVGVSLRTNYGACGSVGAFTDAMIALPYYFKYAAAIDGEYRMDYTAESWFELIQTEINEGRPMIYGIPYHAIVCSGWRDTGGLNQYHMNYGWGGWQSGWYVLDNLYWSPDPMEEVLIREIRPATRFIVEVEADGSGDYPTIQAAVDAAGEGKFIVLSDGVFSGEGNRDIDFHGKALTVRSQTGTPSACVIDCEGLGRGFLFQSGEGATSYLEGITIIHAQADHGAAVYCDGSSPLIARCIFRDNTATQSGGGVYCTGASSPWLLQCTFFGNGAEGEGAGVACDNGSTPNLDHSIVAFSTDGEAVYCDGGATASLQCCDIHGNAGGDWVGCIASQYGTNGNFDSDPLFCNAANGNLAVFEDSPCARDNSGEDCGMIGALGVGCTGTPVAELGETGAPVLGLLTNVPNPFNPTTEITYSVQGGVEPSGVLLRVYNCQGQRVRTLLDAPQPGGTYTVTWDGKDEDGAPVASGVYFCHLSSRGKGRTARMVLLK